MTATPQPESKPTSRRALLAGALGGIGALAASAIGRANPVRAADGNPVVVGGEYTSTSVTKFTNLSNSDNLLWGESSSGVGVYGSSDSNIGVVGTSSSSFGVHGESGSGTGVQGYSGTGQAPAPKPKTGVYGYAAQDSSARGVIGETTSGHGVHGIATSGYAGYFAGKVYATKWYEMTEISAPAAPGANRARLFVRDSGGFTQLCVRFNTGGVKVLATQT
jgi:hypothetical protein